MNDCLNHSQLESLVQEPQSLHREHVEACPRCAARMKMLEAFLAGPADLDPEERSHASAKLLGVLQERARSVDGPPKQDHMRASRRAGSSPRSRYRMATWVAAAAAVVVIGFGIGRQMNESELIVPSGTLRGATELEQTALHVELRWEADGGLHIGLWPVEEGLEYEIEFLDDGLSVVSSVRTEGGSAEVIASALVPTDALMLRVRALRNGELVEQTSPIILPTQ